MLSTAGQLALNFVFGAEPFLYAMHFLPLLVLIAANVVHTRLRPVGLGLAVVIAVTCVINNQAQFAFAAEFIRAMGRLAAGS